MPVELTTRWTGRNGARSHRAQNVPAARRSARAPGERGELAVGHHLAAGHLPKRAGAVPVEPVRKNQGYVPEVVGPSVEKRLQTRRERLIIVRRSSDVRQTPRARQLAVEDASLLVEPHLAHAEARSLVLHQRRFHGTNDVASRA